MMAPVDGISTGAAPVLNVGLWTFEQVKAWAHRPEHSLQELERIREVTAKHAYRDPVGPEAVKQWAKLSLLVNARMGGYGGHWRLRAAFRDARLRLRIIDRLGTDPTDPDWDLQALAADILARMSLTPDQARALAAENVLLTGIRRAEFDHTRAMVNLLDKVLPDLEPGEVRDCAIEWVDVKAQLS